MNKRSSFFSNPHFFQVKFRFIYLIFSLSSVEFQIACILNIFSAIIHFTFLSVFVSYSFQFFISHKYFTWITRCSISSLLLSVLHLFLNLSFPFINYPSPQYSPCILYPHIFFCLYVITWCSPLRNLYVCYNTLRTRSLLLTFIPSRNVYWKTWYKFTIVNFYIYFTVNII